ncbi:MAG TPA: class I SAM-dependent methyltransferase [Propionibacteriaceae bacterium]|nr:class I SAM-dependent methyltransferase [Propionibacteriaceae bacterium]
MSAPGTDPQPASGEAATEFADKVFTAVLGTMETLSLYLGERLGWLDALAGGPVTAAQLAERTQTSERYAVEWLEMQAVYGNLAVIDHGPGRREQRRFGLVPGASEVLTDRHSLSYLGALPRMFAAVGLHLDDLLAAYRTGGGVSWAELGTDARESQAATNRPWFESQLGPALASVPDLHRLLAAPGTRIADIGCGEGWSSIALASAYPDAAVVGIDVDEPSLVTARSNAETEGVADRVSFSVADGGRLDEEDGFDAAFIFEALHDMPRPVEVLTAIRRAVRPGGAVVVVDEAVADDFTAPGDLVEQAMYGYSTLICLPDGLSSTPSEGTGTVLRRSTLTEYATRAGFAGVDVLPIEGFGFFRFYRLG